ncbi:hypothetical protein O6H91_Y177800 [Diphasiastrum complanatum]|nr:hypothetical protein O6H91_Y177800 [Diphasiastrum complanatum]
MEDFANILQRDYGIKPQGKSAPMATSRAPSGFVPARGGSSHGGSTGRGSSGLSRGLNQSADDGLGNDLFFGSANTSKTSGRNSFNNSYGASKGSFDDVFGDSLSFGASKQAPKPSTPIPSVPSYDDIFSTPLQASSTSSAPRSNSFPVYDMPKYDDDIFGGVPGVRSNSTSAAYEDVFGMGGVASSKTEESDDLLGGFGVAEPSRSKPQADASPSVVEESPFDELIPGFGSSEPAKKTSIGDGKPSQTSRNISRSSVGESTLRSTEMDPFSGLSSDPIGLNSSYTAASTFVDPLDPFEMQLPRERAKIDSSLNSKVNGNNVSVSDVFDGFSQAQPSEPADVHPQLSKAIKKDEDITPPLVPATKTDLPEENYAYSSSTNEKVEHFPISPPRKEANDYFSNTAPVSNTLRKRTVRFDEPALKKESPELSRSFTPDAVQKTTEEVWVTIDNVRLVTMPTTSLPPSRPAPRLDFDRKNSAATRKSEPIREDDSTDGPEIAHDYLKDQSNFETASRVPTNFTSSIEDLEQFASGGFQPPPEGITDFLDDEEQAPATKMKEASERVDAKLRAAKEGRERDQEEKDTEAKTAKSKDEREEREKEARINQDREVKEREAKVERERERQRREREREREKDRAAVERATQEARERAAEKAAAEARERAEKAAADARQRAERVAVERVTAEARERAAGEARERAAADAREKAAAEARERAAAEAKERAAAERAAVERATAEARARAERAAVERATAEARERAAERAAVERAAAEARERAEKASERAAVQRAAAEARMRAEKAAAERAAAAAAAEREKQQRRNDNDLESFFNMSSSRAASAPKQRPATSDFVPDQKVSSTDGQRRSPSTAPTVRKVSSTTHIADDWTSLFATPATADFQEIDGEAPERRRARWERHQRTQERAAKALAEKNQRDLDVQREQAEKHRAAETLDAEIRRWAAGKEGNLRALLSTLQYVLWPECGWQPVSLTDLITAAAVKKVYRKATLYVHPDKVQQKGATVQQKYVAEKVFDLLKEAWNKFNSEELF